MASGRQDDCIDKEDYFMLVAVLASKRSKDPNTKVKNFCCSSKSLKKFAVFVSLTAPWNIIHVKIFSIFYLSLYFTYNTKGCSGLTSRGM